MIKNSPFAVTLTLSIALAAACSAQTKVDAQAKDAAAVRKFFEIFVDAKAPIEERVKAASEFGVVSEEADAARLLEVAKNKTEDERVRISALQKVAPVQIDKQIEIFRAILTDPDASIQLKTATVDRLHILADFTYGGAEARVSLLKLLREQIDHPDKQVRSRAMGYLAIVGDDDAVKRLTSQLREKDATLFSPDEAIGYLTIDQPQAHYEVIRPYINAEDEKTLAAAVRALGQDEQSQGKIREYFTGASKSPTVRKVASKVLARYDKAYPSYALEILKDDEERNALRAQVIHDLGAGLKASAYEEQYAPRIQETIESIQDEDAPAIKNAIEDFKNIDFQQIGAPADTQGGAQPRLPHGWTKEDMQKVIAAGTPGKEHAHLAEGAGKWKAETTMWMTPDAPPMTSAGASTVTPIMDGRYVKVEMEGEMPGMGPYHGFGIYGYDNVAKEFVSIWIDNHGTGIMQGKGKLSDDGKKLAWDYKALCPVTDELMTMREIETITGPNTKTLEMWGADPKSGKEFKMMSILLTKEK